MASFTCSIVHGLDECFQQQVQENPDSIAIVQNEQSLSYRDLDNYADYLTTRLSSWNMRLEEPICILLPMGINHIIAQVAVIRLGGSCVPMDVSFPDQRIHNLLNGLDTRFAITDESNKDRLASFQRMIMSEPMKNEFEYASLKQAGVPVSVQTGGEHRTHLLHTSGTTGLPKPVEILAKGITRMAFNKHCFQFKSTDRVAQIAAPSFDVSLFEVWVTLVCGACIIVLPKNVAIDPYNLVYSIEKYQITCILVTTALLNHVISAIPSGAFRNLDCLLVGGEMVNPKVLKAVLEGEAPKNLIHAYGATECTTISTYHLIKMDELNRGLAPIGKPLDYTTCFILNEHCQPVSGNETGDLYIGGDGVARGYYRRTEANNKCFLDLPGLQSDPQKLTRVYKTGDLCRYVDDGAIEFIARADNMVKLRGFRIEPAELESVLLRSEIVQAAVVVAIQRPGKDTYLMAFVVPKDRETLYSGKLDAYMKRMVPQYMVPRIQTISEFPFTVHGKIDRKALIERHVQSMEEADKSITTNTTGDPLAWLKNLWVSILDVTTIDNDSDFFHLGGSSLQAAAIIVHVRRRFGKALSVQDIYNNSKLKDLYSLVVHERNSTAIDHTLVNILHDTKLSTPLSVPLGSIADWQSDEEGHIFLSGATGFLGTHLLRELIDKDYVNTVTCLVRASNANAGRIRLLDGLRKYGQEQPKNLEKIVPLPGDLSIPDYGLSEDCFDALAASVSVIFHVGAHISYIESYEKHRDANVIGTLTSLKLASTGRKKAFHYTSTAAVSGPAAYFGKMQTIFEDQALSEFQSWLAYDIGYTQSKWVAEHLIQNMMAKGLPAVIYRPGFIMGHTVTGKGNSDDFMSRVILGSIRLGCRPILLNQSKSLVPIDFITKAMIQISSNTQNFYQTFHLTPQSPNQDFDLEVLWDMIHKCGFQLKTVSYKDWLDAISQDSELLSNPLLPLLPVLQEVVHSGRTRWELYENMAQYNVDRTNNALRKSALINMSGIKYTDLQNYIKDWRENGLIVWQ